MPFFIVIHGYIEWERDDDTEKKIEAKKTVHELLFGISEIQLIAKSVPLTKERKKNETMENAKKCFEIQGKNYLDD